MASRWWPITTGPSTKTARTPTAESCLGNIYIWGRRTGRSPILYNPIHPQRGVLGIYLVYKGFSMLSFMRSLNGDIRGYTRYMHKSAHLMHIPAYLWIPLLFSVPPQNPQRRRPSAAEARAGEEAFGRRGHGLDRELEACLRLAFYKLRLRV